MKPIVYKGRDHAAMETDEKWLDVANYEGFYQISSCGNIRSVTRDVPRRGPSPSYFKKGKILKTKIGNTGYYKLILWKNSSRKMTYIHRLVAQAFIPNPENKPCVNHKDGNKLNNHVDNLEWCTYSENMKHGFRIGIYDVEISKKNLDPYNRVRKVA